MLNFRMIFLEKFCGKLPTRNPLETAGSADRGFSAAAAVVVVVRFLYDKNRRTACILRAHTESRLSSREYGRRHDSGSCSGHGHRAPQRSLSPPRTRTARPTGCALPFGIVFGLLTSRGPAAAARPTSASGCQTTVKMFAGRCERVQCRTAACADGAVGVFSRDRFGLRFIEWGPDSYALRIREVCSSKNVRSCAKKKMVKYALEEKKSNYGPKTINMTLKSWNMIRKP